MCYNTKGHNYNHENRQEPVSHFCGMKQALRKAGERNMSEKWVTAWGNAISVAERRPENYAKDLTLRYPAKMMLDGSALRITLDNFCGSEPVTVTAVSAAVSDGADGIDTETIVPLTFSGKTSVTIPAGEWVQSDAVRFPVKRGETIAVSLYFAGFTEIRSGVVITGPLSDRKSTRLNSSHVSESRMPSSA